MNPSPHSPENSPKPFDDETKFVPSYQGSKVPWQIHLLWASFAAAGIIYLVRLAIPDMIRWW